MAAKTVEVTILVHGAMCAIPVPFDPKTVFGKVRAPVRVTLNGYTFRSTIASMGGQTFVPLRKSNREAAGVSGGERIEVRIETDTDERTVELPADFVSALAAHPAAEARWPALSYTRRREYVESIEGAKKPETRSRRIEKAVRELGALPPRR